MRFFVYIIGTKYPKLRTYVGWSNDVEKRLKAHNNSKGAKFTRGSKWKLLYQEELSSKSEAMSCLLYTSPSPRDGLLSRMPSSA